MDFTVKTISQDGLDMISYDNNFYIEDGILYHGTEELARDVEDDLLYAIQKITEYCHDTVLEITDDNDEVVYKNEEFEDEEMDWEDGSQPYSDDKELRYNDYFGESFKSLNEKLEKFLEEAPKAILTDEDKQRAEKVTLDNLDKCYNDINRNLYVNGEIVDGFEQEEVANAIKNNCEVLCL